MDNEPTGQSPSGWLAEFLSRRSLPTPDERPLYAYRCSAAEFAWLRQALPPAVAAPTSARDPSVGACFCLYTAEWWRRCYREGPWAWQGIRKELGFSRAVRDEELHAFTERGLDYWRRKLRWVRGRREFLFTLACEGGLPLQLIERDGTHVRAYFRRLLEDLQLIRADAATAAERAAQLGSTLPLRLQTQEVFELGGALVAQILALQRAVADTSDPVAALDQRDPEWKARLPLDMEDSIAQALVRGLLNAAGAVAVARGAVSLRCITLLTREGARYRMQRHVRLPASLGEGELQGLLDMAGEPPSRLQLFAKTEHEERVALAMVTRWTPSEGQTRYILEPTGGRMPSIAGDAWRGGVLLQAVQGTRVLCERPLPGGQPLGDLPWLFTAHPDTEEARPNTWRLFAEGASSTKDMPCILAVPEAARVEAAPGGTVSLLGPLEASGRRLFEISGQVRVVETGDDACTISSGAKEEDVAAYRWMSLPQRLLLDVAVHRAVPDLAMEVAEGTEQRLPLRELQWRPRQGGEAWRPLSDRAECFGDVEVRHAPAGQVRFRAPLRILPPGASIELRPRSLTEGTVRLHGMEGVTASVKPLAGVCITVTVSRPDQIEVHLEGAIPALAEVSLDLQWKTGQRLRISVPSPAAGAYFIGADGAPLRSGAMVHVSHLSRLRARAIATQPRASYHVRGWLRLSDRSRKLDSALQVEAPLSEVAASQQELALDAMQDAIRHRLAWTSDLDATFQLEIVGPGLPAGGRPLLNVCRYDLKLAPSGDREIRLEGASGQEAPVHGLELEALHLTRAEQGRLQLKPAGPNRWRLEVDNMVPGPWLILGREGAWYRARPLLRSLPQRPGVTGENPAPGSLKAAVLQPHPEKRKLALDEAISRLGENGSDPGWELMTHYLSTLGDLPATTFDAFASLVKHPSTAALALLRTDDARFERVWTELESLPFLWATVPACAWRRAAQVWMMEYEAALPFLPTEQRDGFMTAMRELFRRRWSAVEARCKGLAPLFEWLEEELPQLRQTPATRTEPRRIEVHAGKPFASPRPSGAPRILALGSAPETREILQGLRDRAAQELRQSHAEDNWPAATRFVEDFEAPLRSLPSELQDLYPKVPNAAKYQQSVLVAPAFAALTAVWGNAIQGITVLELRQLRDFDPFWFDTAFGCAYASALGITRANYPERLK